MKHLILCLSLFSLPLLADEQQPQPSIETKEVREQLQNIYLNLQKEFQAKGGKTTTGQKKLLSELETYNQQILALNAQATRDSVSAHQWSQMNESLKRVEKLVSYVTVASHQKQQLSGWIVNARNYSDSVKLHINAQPIATRRTSTNSIVAANTINDQTRLIVEDRSLGFDTPQERREFLENITALRAEQSRAMTQAGIIPRGGAPVYPAAYTYSNGSYGNATNLGRRDTFQPIFSNRTPTQAAPREPLIQIRIK